MKTKLTSIERIILRCVIICAFMLTGATVSRCETEKRVLREQVIHTSDGFIYAQYKNRVHKYKNVNYERY